MDEEKFQSDLRTYNGSNCLQTCARGYFLIYVLLGISNVLTIIFFAVVLSKETTLSSQLSQLQTEPINLRGGLDFELFPCGPDRRQWEYFNGKCYYFSLETVSWDQANSHCREAQSQLVVVNNMAEQYFLQTRTRGERYWIGLTDMDQEGEWRWVDGTDYRTGFMHWKRGEPNNDRSIEDCAHLWNKGEWNDVYCTYRCYYICERPLPNPTPGNQRGT